MLPMNGKSELNTSFKGKTLYAAYGSNLDKEQMDGRCPHNEIFATGDIVGYRLAMPFYADIEPCQSASTPCLLYLVSESDMAELDRREGVFIGCYYKITVNVMTSKGNFTALAYIMTDDYRVRGPSSSVPDSYIGKIKRAYDRYGFDNKHLYSAIERKCSKR